MSRKFPHYQTTKKEFLTGVKDRLQNDVDPYFECIRQIGRNSLKQTGKLEAVGFWALVRMIFPVINAVAVVLYKSNKPLREKESDKFSKLLKRLGIKYPRIVLDMYRHSLLHRDQLRGITLGGHRILWSISYDGIHHIFNKNAIMIDMRTLYDDLIKFLDNEIATSGNKKVWVEREIQYTRPIPAYLMAELDEMLNK